MANLDDDPIEKNATRSLNNNNMLPQGLSENVSEVNVARS